MRHVSLEAVHMQLVTSTALSAAQLHARHVTRVTSIPQLNACCIVQLGDFLTSAINIVIRKAKLVTLVSVNNDGLG